MNDDYVPLTDEYCGTPLDAAMWHIQHALKILAIFEDNNDERDEALAIAVAHRLRKARAEIDRAYKASTPVNAPTVANRVVRRRKAVSK